MAYLQLKSTNPDISWVIGKNPTSGMQVRSNRKGLCFGWFTDAQAYNIFFKDSDTGVSYSNDKNGEEFEYINTSRYNSAFFPINAISDFFGQTVKNIMLKVDDEGNKTPADVEGFENSVVINQMLIKNLKYVDIFNMHIEGFEVSVEPVANKNYRVTITTEKTVRELLNFVNLFCMFNALKNGVDWIDLNESAVAKYLHCLQVIDPPYMVRYTFKVNLLRNKKIYDKYRTVLETTKAHSHIAMTYGDTSIARQDFVKQLGKFESNIVDVGCGEGRYIRALCSKIPSDCKYIAIDKDAGALDLAYKKARNQVSSGKAPEDMFLFTPSINDIPEGYQVHGSDMLLVEVIEHMEKGDAVKLMQECLALSPKRLIITTPNKDFNKYYAHEDGMMRHHDHHFELDKEEFTEMIMTCVKPLNYRIKFVDIGDCVDGVCTTQGCILEKHDEQKRG